MNLLWWILGAIALPLILSEATEVSPWLAKRLVLWAARRIPERERPRWQEEWLGELEAVPGRLWKLLWALWCLPILRGAGEMGRLLGAPPVTEVVRARLRAAWQRLRLRPKAPTQEPEREPVLGKADANVVVAATAAVTAIPGIYPIRTFRRDGGRASGMLHLSDEEFIAWLAQTRRAWEADIDRWVEESRQAWAADIDRRVEKYGEKRRAWAADFDRWVEESRERRSDRAADRARTVTRP